MSVRHCTIWCLSLIHIFYLHRLLHSPKAVRFAEPDALVEKVTESLSISLAPEQLEAVRTAARSKVMVLTGGPGTGKTTIINAIIRLFAEVKAKILLAAPTGRAAKRMSETSGREARTIHRLLEYSPQEDGFARNEDVYKRQAPLWPAAMPQGARPGRDGGPPPWRSRPACNLQALCVLSTLSDYGCRDIRRRARRAAQPLTRKTGGARGPAAIPSTFPRAEAS